MTNKFITLEVKLDVSFFTDLGKTPSEIAKEMLILVSINYFRQGKLPIELAVKLANISTSDFKNLLETDSTFIE